MVKVDNHKVVLSSKNQGNQVSQMSQVEDYRQAKKVISVKQAGDRLTMASDSFDKSRTVLTDSNQTLDPDSKTEKIKNEPP